MSFEDWASTETSPTSISCGCTTGTCIDYYSCEGENLKKIETWQNENLTPNYIEKDPIYYTYSDYLDNISNPLYEGKSWNEWTREKTGIHGCIENNPEVNITVYGIEGINPIADTIYTRDLLIKIEVSDHDLNINSVITNITGSYNINPTTNRIIDSEPLENYTSLNHTINDVGNVIHNIYINVAETENTITINTTATDSTNLSGSNTKVINITNLNEPNGILSLKNIEDLAEVDIDIKIKE